MLAEGKVIRLSMMQESPPLMAGECQDAHYLALAQRLGAEFWTADRRLVQAVQATLPWVNLVV